MKKLVAIILIIPGLVMTLQASSRGADDAKDSLEGVWVAQSMEANGEAVPAEAVKRVRFTFEGDKLLVKGNFKDEREEECSFTTDASQSPKHLDFSPPSVTKPILGIYEVKGDELKVCLRHAGSSKERPTEFATKADSNLVLIVFQKQKS